MYKNIVIIILGAVILCFAGFNNKFPLLTTDTGLFINSGFNRNVPLHHTAMYGLFIAHSSWGRLIWLIIFSQALALSITLFYCFRYFTQGNNYIVLYLGYLFFATFCMSASVTSSTIDPGVFASITILCTGLLLFAQNLSQRDFIVIAIITVFSSGMAISNIFTVTLIIIIYSIRLIFQKKYLPLGRIQTNIKRVTITLSLVFTTCLLISAVHFSLGRDFSIINLTRSRAPIKGEIVNIQRYKETGSKTASERSFKVAEKKSMNSFFNSIVDIKITNYDRTGEQSETFQAIYRWYNTDVRECLIARQFQGWLTFTYLNYAEIISILACALVITISIIKNTGTNHRNLFFFIFQAMLIQVLINVLLSENNSYRLVSQIIWLLPVPVFFYLSDNEFIKKMKLN